MKQLRKSHLFKPIFIPFSTSKPRHVSPIQTLDSCHSIEPCASSFSPPVNEPITTHFPNSTKPTFNTLFFDARSDSCTQKYKISTIHLANPSCKPNPIFKTTSFDLISIKFSQIRPFSSAKPDPFSKISCSSNADSTTSSPIESSPPIDAGSSFGKPISLWPGMYHSPVTNALWEARSSIFEAPANEPFDASSEGELLTKTPSQSRTSVFYKFSSDYILREQYRNPWNEVRMGKLLEDLDALAGTIAYKHCCNEDGTTRPLILVTASVDKIVIRKPMHVDIDLKIVGAVTWVGRSSMEIRLEVIQTAQDTPNSSDPLALVANFTFVARDARTGKSAPINRILPETEQEKLLWEEAEERNKIRKMKRAQNKREIDNEKAERLKAMLAEGRIFCDLPALADRDSILIRDTCLGNSLICQPQQRNTHGRIFGGFLMRKAAELAFSTAYAFAGAAPRFIEVDRVDFLKPVDVGNFLRFKSCVLYTELENPAEPLINVEVVAHVTRPELRTSEVSNTFHFTIGIRPEAKRDELKIRHVVPATEEEARRVLERMDTESSLFYKS